MRLRSFTSEIPQTGTSMSRSISNSTKKLTDSPTVNTFAGSPAMSHTATAAHRTSSPGLTVPGSGRANTEDGGQDKAGGASPDEGAGAGIDRRTGGASFDRCSAK